MANNQGDKMKGNHKYFYDGKPLKEYCKEHNICYGTIINRINRRGFSLEEAINIPIRNTEKENKENDHKNKYFYDGKPLKEYCKEHNICYGTIVIRINKGLSLEEAIKKPINQATKNFYKGMSVRKYCKENNINYSTVGYRINMGWSIEDAINTNKKEAYKIGQKKHKKYFYNGMSVIDYCKKKNIPYRTVLRRIQKGWNIEDALNTPFSFRIKKNKEESSDI